MQAEINNYLETIRNSYRNRATARDTSDTIVNEMCKEFCEALHTSEGKRYIKVITGPQRSVHSFIVKEDGPKFKQGDILKAASWAAPAMNFARGNVANSESYKNVSWTGA